jgi:hypothetical protein
MYSTLDTGDRVFVNKLSYRLHDPNRGDVVVLHQITGASERDLIKRVIGLPGETVEVRNCTCSSTVGCSTSRTSTPRWSPRPTAAATTAPTDRSRRPRVRHGRQPRRVAGLARDRPDQRGRPGRSGLRGVLAAEPLAVALRPPAAQRTGRAVADLGHGTRRSSRRRDRCRPRRGPSAAPSRSSCSCCMSQPNATRSNRWNSATSPPFQSVRCRLIPSMPCRPVLGTSFRRALDSLEPGRLQQPDLRLVEALPQLDHPVEARLAQPQALQHRRVDAATTSTIGAAESGSLRSSDSDSRCRRLEQLGERRDVLGQLVRAGTRRSGACAAALDDAVVIEHRDTVGGEPDVALEAGGTELRSASSNASIVFSGACARAPRWAKVIGGSSREGRRCCTPRLMMAGP